MMEHHVEMCKMTVNKLLWLSEARACHLNDVSNKMMSKHIIFDKYWTHSQ